MLERPDSEQLAVRADAEEGDRRIEEPVEVEGVDVVGRRDGPRKGEVLLEERANVVPPRIVDRDHELAHGCLIAAMDGM